MTGSSTLGRQQKIDAAEDARNDMIRRARRYSGAGKQFMFFPGQIY